VTLLFDTQALLWWYEGSRKLGMHARRAIESVDSLVYVSTASVWEIAIKGAVGNLRMREPLRQWLPRAIDEGNFVVLDVQLAHTMAIVDLPFHHADPFDRLLIAQALHEELTILTSDTAFDSYDVETLDARR
jgi:PIN domain nuclease of toxin-antitoxin system